MYDGCSLIADTRQSAAAALNASNAYKSIIDAINKAWNASMEAIRAAEEAKTVNYFTSTLPALYLFYIIPSFIA